MMMLDGIKCTVCSAGFTVITLAAIKMFW